MYINQTDSIVCGSHDNSNDNTSDTFDECNPNYDRSNNNMSIKSINHGPYKKIINILISIKVDDTTNNTDETNSSVHDIHNHLNNEMSRNEINIIGDSLLETNENVDNTIWDMPTTDNFYYTVSHSGNLNEGNIFVTYAFFRLLIPLVCRRCN